LRTVIELARATVGVVALAVENSDDFADLAVVLRQHADNGLGAFARKRNAEGLAAA
jgi:hypothetical protein